MDTSGESAKADLLELMSLAVEVNRNILLYEGLCTALNGLLEHCHHTNDVSDWKIADVAASVELCQDQCRRTKEAHDACASKLYIFAGKHGGQQLKGQVNRLLKEAEETSETMVEMCERMEEIREGTNSMFERVAAFGAVVFEDFEDETWSDDEDYEAERDQPKRHHGQ